MVFPVLWYVIFGDLGELSRADENVAVHHNSSDRDDTNHNEVVQHILEFIPLEAGRLDEHSLVFVSTHLSDLDSFKDGVKIA